ncbi:DUF4429 domain-containing protein [Bacillus badius]|uniref:DUF4429 domain-containing protein n=1 Tax=Bacillus badius TaxID=1455 RepID=UPI000597D77B|nr:DUF4429 domain-containing protein [Bacillus badius]MED4715251.1 DUF4429 domain-containing protein [Bacillus badius]
MMSTFEFKHGGKTTVTIDSENLRIDRKGFFNRSSGLKGEKTIKLSMISSVKIIPASAIKAGFIQFGVTGNKDVKGIYTAGDENTIMFSKKEQGMAEELKAAVERKIYTERKQESSSPSLADELKKLLTLKNEGVLTEEEFQQQKQKLLS